MTANDPEYQRWNTRFAASDYVFGTEPNAFLASQAHRLRPGQRALVPADGEGRNGVWLARQGLDVTTIELTPNGIDKARKLAGRHGVAVRAELGDLRSWAWEKDSYDIAAAIMIQFAPPPLRDDILRGIASCLKRGGLLILQGYRPEQLAYKTGGPPAAENMYSETELRRLFADLNILHLAAHDDAIAEGAGHSGLSALIDLVAERP